MLGAQWRLVCDMPALSLEPLAGILDLRPDAGEVGPAQRHQHLMAVQHGLQRDRHWSFRQRGHMSWLTGRCGRAQLHLDQLLRSPGNRRTQSMFTKLMWCLLIIAAIAMAVDDVVRRAATRL
jgi:hypothetical protein